MPIEVNNKCVKCGDTTAENYVWCDMRHDFICFGCHTKCEHYDGNCFMKGADCKLKHNTDNRQIFVYTANKEDVAVTRLKYKDFTLEQLNNRFNEAHERYLASDNAMHRAAFRVMLAALYLEMQDRQNAYVCVHNSKSNKKD